MVENSLNAIVVIDPQGTILSCNPALVEMLCYEQRELIGANIETFTHPDDLAWISQLREALLRGEPVPDVYPRRLVRKDGQVITTESSVSIVEASGERVGIMISHRDITLRVAAEQALLRSEASLARAQEIAHLGSWEWVSRDDAPRWSVEHARLFGFDPADRSPRWSDYVERVHPEDRERFKAAAGDSSVDDEFDIDFRIVLPDGSIRFMHAHGCDIEGITQDVTERVERERALESSEQRLRSVMETVKNGILLLDLEGRAVFFNDALCRMLGYSREEMEHTPLADVLAPAGGKTIDEPVAALVRGEPVAERCRLRVLRKDGQPIDVEVFRSPFVEHGVTIGSLAEIRDITEELALQRSVEQSAAELASILKAVHNAIILADERGTILRVNPAVSALFGWEEEELLGRNVRELVPEPARSRHSDHLRHYLGTGEPSTHEGGVVGHVRESEGHHKDGTTFPIEINIEEARSVAGDHRTFTAVIHDITGRKQAERYRELAQRTTARAEFFATMSHELRTPLNSILGFGQLLKDGTTESLSERQSEYVGHIIDGGEHLLSLINELLDIARIDAGQQHLDIAPLDPAQTIAEVLEEQRPAARAKGLALRSQLDDVPPAMLTDQRSVRQILTNLVGNAVKFTDSGYVEVRARRDGDRLRIDVEDSGAGIPEEHWERVFEEFERVGQGDQDNTGTGLGLPIAKRLVEALGGEMALASTEGSGSTFTVWLPLGDGSLPETITGQDQAPAGRQQGRVE